VSDERWSPEELYDWVPDAVRRNDRRQKAVLLNVAINVFLTLFLLATSLYWLLPMPAIGFGLNRVLWLDNVAQRRRLIQLYKERTGADLRE
jgi:hypothetical protein